MRLRHSMRTCGHGARLCRGRSIVDSAEAGRADQEIKTDRRDAINLAKLNRTGELTPVSVLPDQAHEAIRDLVRACQPAVRTLRPLASNCPASCCATAITTTGRVPILKPRNRTPSVGVKCHP
jgi:transposase